MKAKCSIIKTVDESGDYMQRFNGKQAPENLRVREGLPPKNTKLVTTQ